MEKSGAKTKLLNLFKKNLGKPINKKRLAKEAAIFDWARVIRTLRQEGYEIELLQNGSYILNSIDKRDDGKNRENIDAKTRYRILQRDNSTCQRCGKTSADKIKLCIDHKIPVDMGGDSSDGNLWVLCEECNLGKKHWFSDNDGEEMTKLFKEKSGGKRLEMFLEMHPNELLDPAKLSVISGIRDWERTLRLIRQKSKKNIVYVRKDEKTGKEGYVYKK
jgi:biotin operon repressor